MPTQIVDVLDRMAAIESELPSADGVAYFNRMYMKVTEQVHTAVAGTTFENDEFLGRLDVVFANRFFAAYESWERSRSCPSAWAPLFEGRDRAGSAPVQFALAGMNAHINNDLPLAVVQTCRELALEPLEDSPEHRDFAVVNDILRTVQALIKGWFSTGVIASVDEACGDVDDAVAMWSLAAARELAWEQAQALWDLEDNPRLREMYEGLLGRLVGLAGRGILLGGPAPAR